MGVTESSLPCAPHYLGHDVKPKLLRASHLLLISNRSNGTDKHFCEYTLMDGSECI